MWRAAWNVKLHKTSFNCAIQLSFNISSIILCSNSFRNCAHNVFKYIFKQIDDSIALVNPLSKYILLRNCYFRKNKYISVRGVRLSEGSYYITKNIFFKSYLFPWDLISKENNNVMSNEQAPLCKKTKMSDDDCIVVHESVDHSDAIIVYEKINNVEIVKDASSSSIHSQSLQKTQILVSERKGDIPERVPVEDDIRECSFDPNKAQRELSRLNELRQWEFTTFGRKCDLSGSPSSNKQYFTVMSYNVLSQDLLENHPYLYYEHDPNALSWEWRSERLLEEIKEAAPDILCLQEVQESHLESFYMPRLQELGYDGIFKKRTGNKPDGVAIYFKVSAFSLVEHTSVEFMQPILPVLNRDNVALIARLSSQLAPSLPHLCIATTHLLYNPKRMDVKLAQMQLLLAEIERMAFFKKGSQPSYYPLILTGDLNVNPKSSVYRLITSGNLWDSDVTDEMMDVLGITDNCQHFNILNSRKNSKDHSVDRISETRQLMVYNSDNIAALHKIKSSEESSHNSQPQEYNIERNRGHLSHNFIFNSVYRHRNAQGKEATTKQDRWVTVDYIFYSCSSREKNWQPIEGNLKLVARYGLLNKHECNTYGPIPNMASPSDHFPLISKFLLLP